LSSGNDRLRESVNSLGGRLGSVEERLKSLEAQLAVSQRDIMSVLHTKESWDKAMWGLFVTIVSAVLIAVFVTHNPNFNQHQNNPIQKSEEIK
jgi:hypothetical protein